MSLVDNRVGYTQPIALTQHEYPVVLGLELKPTVFRVTITEKRIIEKFQV